MSKTFAAGGVVLNGQGKVLVVNQNGDSWSLPKGHIEPDEAPRQAAEREIREESGITELEFLKELGEYERYQIGPGGRGETHELKHITMYLYRTNQTDLKPEDPHHPEARWLSVDQVADLLTHPKDKDFFKSISPLLESS